MKDNVIYVDFSKMHNSKNRNKSFYRRIINRVKAIFHLNKRVSTPKNVIIYRKNIS
ncbi:hypothetical protein [Clostridium liquoris]|uniref:hypothetical protein n=1 Tax=Clostridium liquoris TaxID=1289519 RepID=UPI001475E0B8|nr:hypothetical protein [Clostridium liquoris]